MMFIQESKFLVFWQLDIVVRSSIHYSLAVFLIEVISRLVEVTRCISDDEHLLGNLFHAGSQLVTSLCSSSRRTDEARE